MGTMRTPAMMMITASVDDTCDPDSAGGFAAATVVYVTDPSVWLGTVEGKASNVVVSRASSSVVVVGSTTVVVVGRSVKDKEEVTEEEKEVITEEDVWVELEDDE